MQTTSGLQGIINLFNCQTPEHAHNITMLAWVLDVSDLDLSNMIKDAEMAFTD